MTSTEAWNEALGRIIHAKNVRVDDVLACVRLIEATAGDDELAHGREDDLRESVLEAIRDNRCDNPGGLATAALMTSSLDFARWCA